MIRLLIVLCCFAIPCLVYAGDTKSQLTMLINDRGIVEVVDHWSGLEQEFGTFDYFTATRELGSMPVTIKDNAFTVSYSTKSYLRFEEGMYYFVTPDFYYKDGPLDVELNLTYPPNLTFLDANPGPTYEGDGVLRWQLKDCQHTIVMARFERTSAFVQPGAEGPEYQVDPTTLAQLSSAELPASADEVLKDMEKLIIAARASNGVDPDFIRVLEKLLAKMYYIMDLNGLVLDYHISESESSE